MGGERPSCFGYSGGGRDRCRGVDGIHRRKLPLRRAQTGSFVPFDGSGAAQTPWPPVAGTVTGSVADGSGGWYIVGTFTRIGTVAVSHVAHIRSDGTVDTGFAPGGVIPSPTQTVGGPDLAVAGQDVIVGTLSGVTALDATTGAVDWTLPAFGVSALAASGSTVYVAGAFKQIGGAARNGVASIDVSTGTVTSWNPDVTNAPNGSANIDAIAVSGSTVYVGGTLTTVNGSILRGGAAAFDATTGTATAWDPETVGGQVFALAASASTVYIGGSFSKVNTSVTVSGGLAAVDPTTGTITGWSAPLANGGVYSLAVSGGDVYVGGSLELAGSPTTFVGVAGFDAASAETAFAPAVDGEVTTISVSGSKVGVGGEFQAVGGVRRQGLAAIDLDTGRPTSWNPFVSGLSLGIKALALSGSTVYVGGVFGAGATSNLEGFDATTGAPPGGARTSTARSPPWWCRARRSMREARSPR